MWKLRPFPWKWWQSSIFIFRLTEITCFSLNEREFLPSYTAPFFITNSNYWQKFLYYDNVALFYNNWPHYFLIWDLAFTKWYCFGDMTLGHWVCSSSHFKISWCVPLQSQAVLVNIELLTNNTVSSPTWQESPLLLVQPTQNYVAHVPCMTFYRFPVDLHNHSYEMQSKSSKGSNELRESERSVQIACAVVLYKTYFMHVFHI